MASPIPVPMIGRRFGMLTVLARASLPGEGPIMYRCRCDCGRERVVRGGNLRMGQQRSCGCVRSHEPLKPAVVKQIASLTQHVHPKTCPICGKDFLGTAAQVCCSRRCSAKRRRQKNPRH